MVEPGEEIVGSYLRYKLNCDFVDYNPLTKYKQGEIDVIGLDTMRGIVYICESATHLDGLHYVDPKTNLPNNVIKLIEKFEKNIQYANEYLTKFPTKKYMFWSPIVKIAVKPSAHNAYEDLLILQKTIKEKYGIEIELIINDRYLDKIKELRAFAAKYKPAIKTPIMRFIQIEERLHQKVIENRL